MSARKKRVRAAFRENTFKRDGHKCKICGATEDLAAHHITDRSKMPNGGYTAKNGITLCPPCHLKAEKFHISGGEEWEEGMHPDELYAMVGSSFELALIASSRIGTFGLE